jgi:ankyrin repeat protein
LLLAASTTRANSPDSQLIEAAQKMDVANMADAIAAGARVNVRHGMQSPLTMLTIVSDEHFLPALKFLLQHGADVNGGGGAIIFQVCASPYGNAALPDILAAKPNLKVTNDSGDGVIAVAVQNGNLALISPLLAAGAPDDVPNSHGETAIMLLAAYDRESYREQEYVAAALVLINSGANPQRLNSAGHNAADCAFIAGNYELVRLLDSAHHYRDRYDELRHRSLNRQLADIILRHAQDELHWIGHGPKGTPVDSLAKAKQLLEDGADPNAHVKNAWIDTTMLGLALGDRRNGIPSLPAPQLVSLLLKNGANPNLRFPDGDLPLSLAMRQTDVALLLLKKGADPRGVSEMKSRGIGWQEQIRDPRPPAEQAPQTMLHKAAALGSAEIVKDLLSRGAARDEVDADGYTPLLRAATSGNNEAALALVAAGADLEKSLPSGKTAADIAADARNISLLRQLDRDGRHATLLAEFMPPANDPVIGTWVCDQPHEMQLTFAADGGGRASLTGGNPIAWKHGDWGDTIVISVPTNPLSGSSSLVELPVTYDKATKTLQIPWPWMNGQTLRFHHAGSPPPPAPPVVPSGQLPEVRKAFADSRAAGGAYITLDTPSLTTVPKELYDLPALRNFQMVGTQVRSLPAELGQMRLLESVRAANCRLEEIAPEVCALSGLKTLDVTYNLLHTIPSVVATNPALNELSLDNNFLTELPADWSKAKALTSLTVTENRLRELPEGLAQAPALQNLAAGNNLLTDLPNNWRGWQLRYLQLDRNRFTSVPPVISTMTALTYLNLSGNELHEVGPALGHLPALKRLDLSDDQLTDMPDLHDSPIESLNLSGNRFRTLGTGPEKLPHGLRELYLADNQLTDVPEWLLALPLRLNIMGNPMPATRIQEINRRMQEAEEKRWQDQRKRKSQ